MFYNSIIVRSPFKLAKTEVSVSLVQISIPTSSKLMNLKIQINHYLGKIPVGNLLLVLKGTVYMTIILQEMAKLKRSFSSKGGHAGY